MNTVFNKLTEQEIVDSLDLIGGEYGKIALGEKQQKLDIEDYNKALIENLKSIHFTTLGSGKELKGKLRVIIEEFNNPCFGIYSCITYMDIHIQFLRNYKIEICGKK